MYLLEAVLSMAQLRGRLLANNGGKHDQQKFVIMSDAIRTTHLSLRQMKIN